MRTTRSLLIVLLAGAALLLLAAGFFFSGWFGPGRQPPVPSPGTDEPTGDVTRPGEVALDPGAASPGQAQPATRDEGSASDAEGPAIRGTVVSADGNPVGAGFWVLALDTARPPPGPGEVREAMQGRRTLLLARTDERGAFALEGIAPGRAYRCVAGGDGFMTLRPARNVAAGASDLALTVQKLFGALIQLQDEQGNKPRISSALGEAPLSSVWSEVAKTQPATRHPQAAVLAGLDPEHLAPDPTLLVELFTADTPLDRLGPNHVQVRLPGYEEAALAFDATFLGAGLETIPFNLRRTTAGWGSLVVRFTGIAADVRRSLDHDGRGVIALRSAGGREDVFAARIPEEGELVIPDVPHGRYSAEFRARNGLFTHPADGEQEIPVNVAGEPAVFEVDLSSAGALELSITTPDGAPYGGPAIALLALQLPPADPAGRTRLSESATYEAGRGPHLLGPVRAGSYTVLIQRPTLAPSDEQVDELLSVSVTAGAMTRLFLMQAGER